MLLVTTAFQVAVQPAPPAPVVTQAALAVDKAFAAWSETTPWCAVGVSEDGRSVLEQAYGMADLEHSVVKGPDTIFEAGSVSKQFTAAAVNCSFTTVWCPLTTRFRNTSPNCLSTARPSLFDTCSVTPAGFGTGAV
ncbi:MAG: serine hydrolase [Acidobacteria bacterium]|nr:serine hydrolase [Acidobacteriota bacterium]